MTPIAFELDSRLAKDTFFVADWPLCRVLLMNDARFAWLILVPRVAGLVEIDELAAQAQVQLMQDIQRAMQALRRLGPCDKLNVGALGNIVSQLHVHVVARRHDDAAWPGPVWGCGTAVPYTSERRDELIARLRA